MELPDIAFEHKCQCHNMYLFMKRFEEMTDKEALKKILCKVRHGLHPSQCEWAHKEFMEAYLNAADEKMKRYHACHSPFAKESVLSENVVSSALCNCSLGHVMNFAEAFLGRELTGKVVRSVLNGDLTCEYEIEIPEDIMQKYVTLER